MAVTIEARGLEKRFGKTPALAGLDLVAESGRVTAVLGPNGAGKTTFVRAVATLLRLDGGRLTVAGHDVRKEAPAVRSLIGLAGQFAAVEGAMSGRENLEMVARLYGQDRRTAKASAARVLEQLGLADARDRLVRTYSGGMKRRLDLGASLVGAPRLLLLDEPTTGLAGNSQAAQAMGMIVFPFAFISSAYIPVSTMPGWLQAFADHQPLTPMVDTVRALTLGSHAQTILGHPAGYHLTPSLLWTAAIVAVCAPLAVARYRRG